ncbi:BTB/POZ domain and ankyrin repeat-containing protein [Actinidia chinensis var. chinensis]|uniref:BTB/POZ domain and ankyrin repeat-containing protein n=1 Tax=Actinidia chinensis var. chinensis TaxID=1590841 RepID=A0A2R6Q2Y4_ACTCC|nr:BTB/POZ domain and ankyrin repeat-containing protein [Actinidia chinensis var. chinensis]
MADKASRGLVVYGDGLARFIDKSHANLHSLASRGCCGFLSLPYSPPSESEDSRIVREFAQLLDACEASPNGGDNTADVEYQKCLMPTISERFMGMRSAIITNNSRLKAFGGKLGFTMLQLSDLLDNGHAVAESARDVLAPELLKLLGFQDGKTSETNPFDLVFIHVGDGEKNGQKDTEYVNNLVGGLMHIADPRSEIGSRLHMSLVMSYGSVSEDDDPSLSVLTSKDEDKSDLSLIFPRQSYTMKGQNLRNDVRHHSPMLIAQWQNGVTRKDAAEAFSFNDFKEHGAGLTIPADRFVHEIAFKLWKAPKYGA